MPRHKDINLELPRNKEMYDRIIKARSLPMERPRIGDYIKMLDGTLRRFTHDWDDGLQTTMKPGEGWDESFFLFDSGNGSFSGALDSMIPNSRIRLTTMVLPGRFWVFDEGMAGAGRGVNVTVECRVYLEVKE